MSHCVSCLADSSNSDVVFLSLYKTYMCDGDEEIYSEMFKSCFNIIFELPPDSVDRVICSMCLVQLKSAHDFKLQTINVQEIILQNTTALHPEPGDNVMREEYLDPSLWEDEGMKNESESPVVKVESEDLVVKIEDLYEVSPEFDDSAQYDVQDLDKKFLEGILPNNNEIVIKRIKREDNIQSLSETYRKKLTKKGWVKKNSFVAKPYTLREGQTDCEYCGKQFVYQKLLVEHMNVHFPNCICAKCGKKYVNKESLKRHEKSHWVGPFTCNVCGKVFNTYNTYTAHKYYKHSENPYKCRCCDDKFSTFMKRLNHMIKEHNIERKYECEMCDKKFYHSGQRTTHIRKVHTSLGTLVKCSSCPKTFQTRDALRLHKTKDHSPGIQQKHICGVCNKALKSMSALKLHMRSHGSGPRYLCHVCKTSFLYRCSLTNHVINHQKNGINAKVIGDAAIVDDGDMVGISTVAMTEEFV